MSTTTKLSLDDYENLVDICIDYDVEVYLDYSGRAMYGDVCFGFYGNIDTSEANSIVLRSFDDNDLAKKLLEKMTTDSLGLDTIYYFPGYVFDLHEETD
jgi:hypothetical protein